MSGAARSRTDANIVEIARLALDKDVTAANLQVATGATADAEAELKKETAAKDVATTENKVAQEQAAAAWAAKKEAEAVKAQLQDRQHPGAVDVVNKKCEDCRLKHPGFGLVGENKRRWCKGCAEPHGGISLNLRKKQ